MARRQLIAVLALGLVAGLVIGLGIGLAVGRADEETRRAAAAATVPDGDVGYPLVVQDLRAALASYAVLAQSILDHDQVHGLITVLRRHEGTLEDVAARAGALGSEAGAAVAALADTVRQRMAQVRDVDGVGELQALGREAGVRAAALDAALAGGSWDAVAVEVDRPWPPAGAEGADTPVG